MFLIHIENTGYYPPDKHNVMGQWFGKVQPKIMWALLFVGWPGGDWLDDYCQPPMKK